MCWELGLENQQLQTFPSPGQACTPPFMGNSGAVPSVLRRGAEEQLDKWIAQPTRKSNHTGTKQHLGRRELVYSDTMLLFVCLKLEYFRNGSQNLGDAVA